MILTPLTDKAIQVYEFKTKEGNILNETITPGQKLIMECILGRRAPTEKLIKRIHTMAHTRFGKSISIAAAVCIRASLKKEPWAIVAGNKEQAQIIMDYVIQFSVNDPILKSLLVDEKTITIERLTQRRKRDHITYKLGGEIRAYGAGRDGEAVMGMGSPSVVIDESSLVNDNSFSKIFRMLGDQPDNFLMEVGNPFKNNHFKDAYISKDYYHINIDYHQGIAEGRVTESFINETRNNKNFGILYENIFPDEEAMDERGWLRLFNDSMVRKAQVEKGMVIPWGNAKDGCDPAGGGSNEAVIARRWPNIAEVKFENAEMDSIDFATEIAIRNKDVVESVIDEVGVGNGTFNLLSKQEATARKVYGINAGGKVPDIIPRREREQYFNLRAYCFDKLRVWLEQGGKLVKHDDWKQLLEIRYKNNKGKIQIISKDELRKYYAVDDLGKADALSFTFVPHNISNKDVSMTEKEKFFYRKMKENKKKRPTGMMRMTNY